MIYIKYPLAVCACMVFTMAFAQTPTASVDVISAPNENAVQTTVDNTLLPPVYYRPHCGTKIVSIPVELQYEVNKGATRYNVQVATDRSFPLSSIVFRANIPGSTTFFTDAQPHTKYYWRAQSIGPDGISKWGYPCEFDTRSETLEVPTLLSPADGAEGVPMTLTLRWELGVSVSYYYLWVSMKPDLSEPLFRKYIYPNRSDHTFTVPSPGTYYWAVQGNGAGASSPRSAIWSFTTTDSGKMSAPVLLTPWNGQSNVPVSVDLRFAPVVVASRYNVQVATDPGFSNIVFRTNVPKSPVGFVGVPGGRYYWRVQAVRSLDWSSFSPAWSFTMGSSSALVLLENYPNPFNPTTVVAVDLPEAAHIRATVYDMLGQEVAQLADGDLPAGRHTFTFDASGLPSGMYVCRVESQGFSQVRSMLLMR